MSDNIQTNTWLETSGINSREYRAQEYRDEYTRLRNKKDALKEKLQPAKEQLYTTRNVMQNIESVLGIKFYEDDEKETVPEGRGLDNARQQEDREQQKKAADKCFMTGYYILLLKYSCVTCNCFFNISLHI